MRRLDWECSLCERQVKNLISAADAPPPTCPSPECGAPMIVDWSGGGPGCDLFSDGGFEFEWDGGEKTHVRTLADVRKIEKKTEELARDGIHRPIRFRDYSQDSSNRDRNLFGEPPREARERPQTRSNSGIPFVGRATGRPKGDE